MNLPGRPSGWFNVGVLSKLAFTVVLGCPVYALASVQADVSSQRAESTDTADQAERRSVAGMALHQRLLTIDSHVDVPQEFGTMSVDPGRNGDAQVDLSKMRQGGLDCVFFSAAVGQRSRDEEGYETAYLEAVSKIYAIRNAVSLHAEQIVLATSPKMALAAHRDGKLAAAIGIENGFAIGKDLDKLSQFRELGVSYVTIVHLGHNDIGDTANPVPQLGNAKEEHSGLSPFGREVVAEMNRLGIMIDVSHAARKTMLDVIDASTEPVIASHSAVYGLVPVARNMDDAQLTALKRNGGVIQIIAYSPYLREEPRNRTEAIQEAAQSVGLTSHLDWVDATNAQYRKYGELLEKIDSAYPRANISHLVDHIDYVVERVGIDHVGIGSDFHAGGGAAVGGLIGWMDATESPNITGELIRRGYSEEEIGKIWGGNLLRVWQEVTRTE